MWRKRMKSQNLGLSNRIEFQYCLVMHASVPTYLRRHASQVGFLP